MTMKPKTMTPNSKIPSEARLYELWGEIRDLQSADDLLQWDQETQMPAGGVEGRAKVSATLAGLRHQKLTSREMQDVLAACDGMADEDGGILRAQVTAARREVERAVKVPESLVRQLAEASSSGLSAWREAREAKDMSLFAGHLAHLVDLRRQEAAAIAADGHAYDTMLDAYEPGMTEAQLVPIFSHLQGALAPLVQAVAESGVEIDQSPALGNYPLAAQEALGRQLATAVGFDFDNGRLDLSTHPFCMGVHGGDVRMTWRSQDDDFRPAVFGILHETGHGLYEQGLPSDWLRTPLGEAVSLGIHESQSRLWENHVGRSLGFWRWAMPLLHEHLPATAPLDAERLWPLLHTVTPSLIRVEADEATYNLHVIIRFELERALFSGNLQVADLEGAWNDLYAASLGQRPGDAAEGVLQDIHWSQGMFGYFPTYTLGTLTAAQLFAQANRELGDQEAAFARGELAPLLGWMRDKIHRHGSRHTAAELVQMATGRPLAADDLLAYLRSTVGEVYGLDGI